MIWHHINDIHSLNVNTYPINRDVYYIADVNIRNEIPNIYTPKWMYTQPNVDYLVPPVVINIGNPIVDMPGCVTVHQDDKVHKNNLPKDKDLVKNDEGEAMTLCPDGTYPAYSAMNYEPDQLTITRETEAPPVAPPPEPDITTPETPEIPNTDKGDPDCPGAQSLRIGSIGPNEKEKVVGHELQKNAQGQLVCVELYEDIGIAEQYLPSAQVAATTASIAAVAGASALLAKPLADLLLRVFKPAIKQVLTKVNKALGKTPYKPTRADIIADEYRKKKGLPPIKRKK